MKLEVIRVMDDDGQVVHPEREPNLTGDELRRLFRAMTLQRILDDRMIRMQRVGRIGFYLTCTGEEAVPYGTAHALREGDWIFSAYRETGAALYRGYPLRTFMNQMFGNAEDTVKGRQMPVHHTARNINFVSISSPVGSQIPNAVGAAWAAKLQKKDDVVVGFFGEGATSTPTFHVSANFAAIYKIPVILICRNNGWAISVPRSVQTASPTFAQKASAYGLVGMLVDGNDVLAMIHAVREAAARARRGEGATLIEARTYRIGAHSTSDDPSVYRDPAEPTEWKSRDPLHRLRDYMQRRGELPKDFEATVQREADAEIRQAIAEADRVPPKPPLASLFEDVYAEVPWHLREQQAELEAEIRKHGNKGPDHGE
ncbi:MAG TPA: thiamine pyrophosphate-dependent enzyme [Polyangia bacterium]|nr:thiamine pyrophosphate-dependent enzyme [Polyangia bacterium]